MPALGEAALVARLLHLRAHEGELMSMSHAVSDKRTARDDRGPKDKRIDRASIRKAILGSLGKPDRRAGEVVEHRLALGLHD